MGSLAEGNFGRIILKNILSKSGFPMENKLPSRLPVWPAEGFSAALPKGIRRRLPAGVNFSIIISRLVWIRTAELG
jgi:hypothetical protein